MPETDETSKRALPPHAKRLDKGLLTVLLCLAALGAGAAMRFLLPGTAAELTLYVGAAGLIGAMTNRMAIEALFSPWPTRRLALPYTGLIERNRLAIIDAIAETVSGELLTREALLNWLREGGVIEKLRSSASQQVRHLAGHEGPSAELRRRISRALRQRLVAALDSPAVYREVREFVRSKAGVAGMVGHVTGISDYDNLTYSILDGVKQKVNDVLVTDVGSASPQLSAALNAAADALDQWDLADDPAIGELMSTLVDHLEVHSIVHDSLGRYSPEEIKLLIQRLSRRHLAWLEVYGGLFGALGGAGMFLIAS
jgi:uncharacterized membrane-anchored protein YjiN (DUF445 family)